MEWESVYTCNCFLYQFDIKKYFDLHTTVTFLNACIRTNLSLISDDDFYLCTLAT